MQRVSHVVQLAELFALVRGRAGDGAGDRR
jgi:hypothetical protein